MAHQLISRYNRLHFSVSCTTRQPRVGEMDGRDYFFVSKDDFLARRDAGYFAEWAEVHGNYYGTPLQVTHDILAAGSDLLFDIDVQGAAQLKQSLCSAFFVFILPPSRQELESRLHNRQTDDEKTIAVRMRNALNELKEAHWFDAWVINDNPEQAFEDLCAVYRTACLRPSLRPEFLQDLLEQFQ